MPRVNYLEVIATATPHTPLQWVTDRTMEFLCPNGHNFVTQPSLLLHGRVSCKFCHADKSILIAGQQFSKLLGRKRFSKRVSLTSPYAHSGTMTFFCTRHGTFEATRNTIRTRAFSCRDCQSEHSSKHRVLPHDSYAERVKAFGVEVLDRYVGSATPIRHLCTKHGYVGTAKPERLTQLQKPSVFCCHCKEENRTNARALARATVHTKAAKSYIHSLNTLGYYKLVGGYVNATEYTDHLCIQHGLIFKAQPYCILRGIKSCPKCKQQTFASAAMACFEARGVEIGGKKFQLQGYEDRAIRWIMSNTDLAVDAINCGALESSYIPVISYNYAGRPRNYYPDIFIEELNLVVEVKSPYTLTGVAGCNLAINKAKAEATYGSGFRFALLLMLDSGSRIKLPKHWYTMDNEAIMSLVSNAIKESRSSDE